MKKISILFALFVAIVAYAQEPFVGVWNAPRGQIVFATEGEFSYSYEKVGNPSINGIGDGWPNRTELFVSPGKYKISIVPKNNNKFRFKDLNNFLEVQKWGSVKWADDLSGMFANCNELQITADDTPDLSGVTSLSGLFSGCSSLETINGLNDWDVSNVQDMSYMFSGATHFNQDLFRWNMGNVKNVSYMFQEASTFNGDIHTWEFKNLENMEYMFREAFAFNGDVSNWNVGTVTNMKGVFYRAKAFSGDVSNWNVSQAKNMEVMFYEALQFNSDLSRWDVGNVTLMYAMFSKAPLFNSDLSNWNVSNVTGTWSMFQGATAFNSDISRWDVSKVTDMNNMFKEAEAFDQDISQWDVSKVTNMGSMFESTKNFNKDISNWDVSSVQVFDFMFEDAKAFNQSLAEWKIKDKAHMTNFLKESGMDCENYSKTLKGWADNPNTGKEIHFYSTASYGDSAKPYRQKLIDEKDWKIYSDSYDSSCTADLATETVAQRPQFFIIKPVKDELHIQGLDGIKSIEIYSANGSLVKTLSTNQRSVSNLSKGVYILKINTQNATYTDKIIKD